MKIGGLPLDGWLIRSPKMRAVSVAADIKRAALPLPMRT
jgi:hypothetical protein